MNKLLLAIILLAPLRVNASEMVGATYRDFSGGLRNDADASEIEANESPNLLNVIIDNPRGSVHPRDGFELCGDTPSGNVATSLYEWFKADGTRKLIVSDNQTVWETGDCSTFTSITLGHNANSKFDFSTVRGDLWMVKQDTHPVVWDGSTTTVLDAGVNTPNPAPPDCRFVEFWKERVWCGRSDSDPSGIAFSALTDDSGNDITPSTGSAAWPAINVFQVDQDGAGPIYGVRAFRDKLYVFKNDGIWRILFTDEFNNAVVRTLSSVGTRFDDSIVELDGFLYFVGPDGIYAFDGDRSIRLSDRVIETFEAWAQPLVNNKFKAWTSNSDFSAGAGVRVATTEVNGSILIATTNTYTSDFSGITDQFFTMGATITSNGWAWNDHSPDNNRMEINSAHLRPRSNGYKAVSALFDRPNFTNQAGRQYDFTWYYTPGTSQSQKCDVIFMSVSTGAVSADDRIGYGVQLPAENGAPAVFRLNRYDLGGQPCEPCRC